MLVLDSHCWIPLLPVGITIRVGNDDSHDDLTPPSSSMEHPPIAVFFDDSMVCQQP
ncbi:hypothetical protein AMTR_s00132p00056770 [Amborella trichopoda]|uniref:Uncharacterized protein n=1 Tax=Amborella trichopoda TaxID=13333 RepID=W1NDN1_AMBTC|nr:hypothetical protein AMTR_s00132p00056770 [Amborella trichopoda]